MDAEGHVMADERYEWLDKGAAEKLLRGEPVDPVVGHGCTEAERLAAALGAAARAARPAAGELRGEAAALAAFRAAARPAHARTGAADPQVKGCVERTGEPGRADVLETVRIRPASGGAASGSSSAAHPARDRALRWSRPVRFGLAASFAGFALGGVAVAAGTGMLPGPFGGHAPVPATSVSSAATPKELGSGPTADESGPARPPASPEAEHSAHPGNPSAPAGDGNNGRTGKGEERGGDDSGKSEGAGRGSSNSAENGKQSEGWGNGSSGAWYATALKACRDYRNGNLDEDRKRYLEALAKGARNLDRFCDRVIARDTKGQSNSGNNGNGNGSNNGNGNGNSDEQGEDGDANGDGDGESAATLPAIGFTTAPSPSPFASDPVDLPTADDGAGSPG
ncbi:MULTISPECIES: hypothetical protein [unclassified Streptomyces]|uniref:hypothetical protein n=1 Tax=unclassified Streptomyces TaxID=2593676 RepID=UPI0035D7E194